MMGGLLAGWQAGCVVKELVHACVNASHQVGAQPSPGRNPPPTYHKHNNNMPSGVGLGLVYRTSNGYLKSKLKLISYQHLINTSMGNPHHHQERV